MKFFSSVLVLTLAIFCVSCCFAENVIISETIAVGDIVTFGHYEQDNNLDNGPEPIEWIVLDVQDGKVLLLSQYGLDAQPFFTEENEDRSWKTCSLRMWLNTIFLDAAFSDEEKAAVLITYVNNSDTMGFSPHGYETLGGDDTEDQVFLLSYQEANQYLGVTYEDYNNQSPVKMTAYAKGNGAQAVKKYTKKYKDIANYWWLRSIANYGSVTYVAFTGALYLGDGFDKGGCVRPAIWVNVNNEVIN